MAVGGQSNCPVAPLVDYQGKPFQRPLSLQKSSLGSGAPFYSTVVAYWVQYSLTVCNPGAIYHRGSVVSWLPWLSTIGVTLHHTRSTSTTRRPAKGYATRGIWDSVLHEISYSKRASLPVTASWGPRIDGRVRRRSSWSCRTIYLHNSAPIPRRDAHIRLVSRKERRRAQVSSHLVSDILYICTR